MSTATVTFREVIIDDQSVRAPDPNDTHMFSNASFTLEFAGKSYSDMSVVIRQPFGTDTDEPIEVEKPSGSYKGNWNHNAFRDIVEEYFRLAEARAHISLGIPPHSRNFGKKDVRLLLTESYQFDIPD